MAKQTQKPATKLTKPAAAAQAVREATGPTTLTNSSKRPMACSPTPVASATRPRCFRECKAAIRSAEMFGLVTVEAERTHYRSRQA